MSPNLKIALLVGSTLLVICGLIGILLGVIMPLWAQSVIRDVDNPEQAKKIAAMIADYTLLPGYTEQFDIDLASQTVVISSEDKTKPSFHLEQSRHSNTKLKEMDQQLRSRVKENDIVRGVTYWFVGERKVKVKDEIISLYITESESQGVASRQAVGLFPGKTGLVTVRIEGEQRGWDWDLIERFLLSIR